MFGSNPIGTLYFGQGYPVGTTTSTSSTSMSSTTTLIDVGFKPWVTSYWRLRL